MVATVNASTSAGVVITPDNSGVLAFQSSSATALTIDASQNSTFVGTASATKLIPTGSSATGNGLYLPAANSLGFSTNGTEAMRIDSSGSLLVGATSGMASAGGAPFQVSQNGSSGAWLSYFENKATSQLVGLLVKYINAAPNDTASSWFYCQDSSAIRVRFASNGGLYNYSGNDSNLSDRREKTNFSPAKSYLNTICSIPVQTFNYIDQSEDDQGLTLGVVAQDVQAVAPEMVTESNWGTEEEPKMRLSIYQTDLQYALMKSIQELKAINDTLTARIVALENR